MPVHGRQQAYRLERTVCRQCWAQYQNGIVAAQVHINGHHRAGSSTVPARGKYSGCCHDPSLHPPRTRATALQPASGTPLSARNNGLASEIDLGQEPHIVDDVIRPAPTSSLRLQDARYRGARDLQLVPAVIELHRGQRFDKERRAARGLVLNQPGMRPRCSILSGIT